MRWGVRLVGSCGSRRAAHVDVQGLSPSSAPSPVSSLPSSPTVADTDAAARVQGLVVLDAILSSRWTVDELEMILELSRHVCEDGGREARRGVVWGVVVTSMGEGELMPR